MKGNFPIDKFRLLETPFYYYDIALLRKTLEQISNVLRKHGEYRVHYAVKANANPKILSIIKRYGLGADCVSGGEVALALKAGFSKDGIVFAGVGKTDKEISHALDNDIFCFNVESIPELEVINTLSAVKGKTAKVALRINPNIGAHTHSNIVTGLAENKFGINLTDMDEVIGLAQSMPNVKLVGLHFHIGSQILDMGDFAALCNRINEIQGRLLARHVILENINVGGGLGINYEHPNREPIADFETYFGTYRKCLKLLPGQTLHFELGRSIVAPCGSLISRVTYIKQGANKQFAILDAGMTDLIRPALYQAYHKIENITSEDSVEKYDVVGPICESSDVFGKARELNRTKRGDIVAIRSAGAYGESQASTYNCRPLPYSVTSEEIGQILAADFCR